MDRARVVADTKLPPDIVRMGSRVQYRTDRDEQIQVVLVFPVDADVSQDKISVLTPVGAALMASRFRWHRHVASPSSEPRRDRRWKPFCRTAPSKFS